MRNRRHPSQESGASPAARRDLLADVDGDERAWAGQLRGGGVPGDRRLGGDGPRSTGRLRACRAMAGAPKSCRCRGGREAAGAGLRRSRLSRRLGLPLPPRRLPRGVRNQRHRRHALRIEAHRARHPRHHRGHELRRPRRERQARARTRRERDGDQHHHRRRRHDRRGARGVADAGLPVPALALRHAPGPAPPRRRHRGGGRTGGEARGRRHAARAEDHRPRGRDAHPSRGDRPAQPLAPSRLDRAPTTWRSRSGSCAKLPAGRNRST